MSDQETQALRLVASKGIDSFVSLLESGLIDESKDIVGGIHCMAPHFIRQQLEMSLDNLGLEALDVYYLHNPIESQLPSQGKDELCSRLRSAFEALEGLRQDGSIGCYGMATWSCFRVPNTARQEHFNLEDAVSIARDIGGVNHGLRYIQVPVNMAMTEVFMDNTQTVEGTECTLLEAAEKLDVNVVSSVPLFQGQLVQDAGFPPSVSIRVT
jgi:aryl-alcohol dehydrogenase-like predicted oxidoreductase